MIWILALLCLGVSGLIGFYQGPIRAGFSLLGWLLASVLAAPLARFFMPIVNALGVKHPVWVHMLPAMFAFLLVLIVFVIIGSVVHTKVTVAHKYGDEDARYYRWERAFQRLGICLGLFCGAVAFFVLLLPVYVGGYFTSQFASDEDPASVRMITNMRSDLHALKLDRVLAAYDPTPHQVYDAADTMALILKNRLLISRISHYPMFLSLAERQEYRDLAADVEFHRMFQSQAKASDIIKYPKIQAIVTNTVLSTELIQLMGDNLVDFKEYLQTGKSPKFDQEKLLGSWIINRSATLNQERKKLTNLTLQQLTALQSKITPQIIGLNLVITTDNQAVLKRDFGQAPTVLVRGTWKKVGDSYLVSFPNSNPEITEVTIQGDQILFSKDGVAMVFDRDL